MLEAARRRGQAVDHLLFAGPPGLGKTSLAGIVANEMGAGFRITSGPGPGAGRRPGRHPDQPGRGRRAVHRRDPPAGPGGRGDPLPGDGGLPARHRARQGPGARSIRLDLPRFTLVGATTRTGLITGPLRDRFGFVARLDYYSAGDLEAIVRRAAAHPRRARSTPAGAAEIARRARGTPRIANRLLQAGPRLRRGPRRRRRSTRRSPGEGLDAVRGRRARPRQGRPGHPRRRLQPLRRRTGRAVDAGRQRRRGDRHGRGRLRAVPDAAGPADAHAAGPGGDPGGLAAPRPRAAGAGRAGPPPPSSPTGSTFRSAAGVSRPVDDCGSDRLAPARGRPRLRPARGGHRPGAGRAARRGPAARRHRPGGPVDHRTRRATCPTCCGPGDVLVVNTTRVLPARLRLRKATGGRGRGAAARAATPASTPRSWAGARPPGPAAAAGHRAGRRPTGGAASSRSGDRLADGRRRVRLLADRDARSLAGAAARSPLPPYIHEPLADPERYQTVYADQPGSVAAPTAGLHLTAERARRAAGRGASMAHASSWPSVSARSGRSTAARVEDHVMHPSATASRRRPWPPAGRPGRVVAVGTTTRAGARDGGGDRRARRATPTCSSTAGFRFRGRRRAADQLPPAPVRRCCCCSTRSAAPGGGSCTGVALDEGYRFLSFGDAMLVGRARPRDDERPVTRSPRGRRDRRRGPRRAWCTRPGARSPPRASCRSAPGARCALLDAADLDALGAAGRPRPTPTT